METDKLAMKADEQNIIYNQSTDWWNEFLIATVVINITLLNHCNDYTLKKDLNLTVNGQQFIP